MKKKRLALLLSLCYLLSMLLPTQMLFAKETTYLQENAQEVMQRTTSGNIEVENPQTTPSAIDTSALEALIEVAQELFDGAVVGTTPGCYDIIDKTKFELSIAEAKEALQVVTTQQEVEVAIAKLNQAIAVFKLTIVPPAEGDANGNGVIDVADLALIAYYYGAVHTDDNWEQVKKCDVNQDGKVDITDLTIVAQKMLNR